MEKPLKAIVKEKMNDLGITPQDLQEATGIPATRIYKWYSKSKEANPKGPDTEKLKKWLGESSKSYNEASEQTENNPTLESLARSIELNAKSRLEDIEVRKIEAKNMERLIALLETKINSGTVHQSGQQPVLESGQVPTQLVKFGTEKRKEIDTLSKKDS